MESRISRNRRLVFTVMILVTGALLRFGRIDRMALWGDEACMVYLCQEPVRDIVSALAAEDRPDVDVAPPAYFILLHAWMKVLGHSVTAFRAFSALFGTLTVAAALYLGTILFNPTVGLLTGLITAVNPFQIWYSQEGRMYSLASFLVTLCLITLVIALRKPGRLLQWIPFQIATVLLIYTQYYGFLLLGALTLFFAVYFFKYPGNRPRGLLRGGILTLFVWIAAFAPWFPVLLLDYSQAGAPGGFPSMFHPLKTPVFLFLKMTLFGNQNYVMDHPALYPLPLLILLTALLMNLKNTRWEVWLCLCSVLIPFLIVFTGSLVGMRIYKSHPFILFQIPLLVLIARGFTLLKRPLRIPAIAIVLAAMMFITCTLSLGGTYVKPRMHDVVAWLETRVKSDDKVAVLPAFLPNPMPIVGDLLTFRYHSRERFDTTYLVGDNASDVFATLSRIMPSPPARLFLVFQDNPQVKPQLTRLESALKKAYHKTDARLFPSRIRGFTVGIDVYEADR